MNDTERFLIIAPSWIGDSIIFQSLLILTIMQELKNQRANRVIKIDASD